MTIFSVSRNDVVQVAGFGNYQVDKNNNESKNNFSWLVQFILKSHFGFCVIIVIFNLYEKKLLFVFFCFFLQCIYYMAGSHLFRCSFFLRKHFAWKIFELFVEIKEKIIFLKILVFERLWMTFVLFFFFFSSHWPTTSSKVCRHACCWLWAYQKLSMLFKCAVWQQAVSKRT